ncbi:MAG: DUF4886 domain-containing protein [Clostridium butyricum]|nr:DUF4886 domain-containing protein [Clostridium butyricum]
MKFKFFKKSLFLITFLVLTTTLITSCSLAKKAFIDNKKVQVKKITEDNNPNISESTSNQTTDKVMDFNKKLNLRKPNEPISKTPSILFLGNSFIFVNDLPSMFTELSNSGGFSPDVYDLTEGYYRLELFADKNDEIGAQAYDALENYEWDYVILQEQSRVPTVFAETNMYPAARTLDQLIKNSGGQTVFFMTWAYKNGDDLSEFGMNLKTTREEMQTLVANSYFSISEELDSLLSPIGIAFMRCAEKYPEINLWDEEDLMHSSVNGTYLAACTLYGTLYNESPVGLTYTADLDADTAAKLQEIADSVIFES